MNYEEVKRVAIQLCETSKSPILEGILPQVKQIDLNKLFMHNYSAGTMSPLEFILLASNAASLPNGSLILDIGTGNASSSIAFLLGSSEDTLVISTDSIDYTIVNELKAEEEYLLGYIIGFQEKMRKVPKSVRLRYKQIREDGSTIIRYIKPEIFDLVFIDNDHLYASVVRDINIADKLLKHKGLVIGHDYHRRHEGDPCRVMEAVQDEVRTPRFEELYVDMQHTDQNSECYDSLWFARKA